MTNVRETARILLHPEITVIRHAVDCFVEHWNVPAERTSSFFHCYYNYTPQSAEVSSNGINHVLGPEHVIIIPPNVKHTLKQYKPFRQTFMYFVTRSPFNKLNGIISVPAGPYLQYLEAAETPLLDQIALRLNMSVSNLSHRFKKATGMTPIQYALIHLADQDGPSIKNIAAMCGFSNRYHFSKQFKKNDTRWLRGRCGAICSKTNQLFKEISCWDYGAVIPYILKAACLL